MRSIAPARQPLSPADRGSGCRLREGEPTELDHPAGPQRPDEVANMVVYACPPQASAMTARRCGSTARWSIPSPDLDTD